MSKTEPSKKLLEWFHRVKRPMPWRTPSPRDPYAVVVSEVMLQQTQVTTVLRFFEPWLEKFPTFAALAEAATPAVLKAWEGLGYYNRARNLQKLAQTVVTKFGGRLPRTVEELETLPGLGRYSARSIASIAFGLPVACVDGNVVRVLARLNAIATPYKSASAAQHDFQPIADKFLTRENPGDHNEAMMELGATVCTKSSPRCGECPLAKFCKASAGGNPESFPVLDKVKITPKLVRRVWITHGDALLLEKKADNAAQLSGLYELPTPEALGIKKLPKKETLRRVRSITRYKITEAIYKISTTPNIIARVEKSETLTFVPFNKIQHTPLSGPHAQWIGELRGRKKRT